MKKEYPTESTCTPKANFRGAFNFVYEKQARILSVPVWLIAKKPVLCGFLLFEVSVEEALECLAVTSFVASHLVNGVVDMAKPAFVEKIRNTKENSNFFGTTFQSNQYELIIGFNIF